MRERSRACWPSARSHASCRRAATRRWARTPGPTPMKPAPPCGCARGWGSRTARSGPATSFSAGSRTPRRWDKSSRGGCGSREPARCSNTRRRWQRLQAAEQPEAARTARPEDLPVRSDRQRPEEPAGRVYLVGAGPGDPGLLTARALALIATADVVLYDRLTPAAALDGARPEAELLFVGKEGGGESVPQEHTEALMVERARAGKVVVRLKGGDPFVFGRGGEEALTLRDAGIAYEVVPGVTAGIAAPAYAGIPVTHRGLAGAVALITGHGREQEGDEDLDWAAL